MAYPVCIVLEGADGTGKSTLAAQLATKLNAQQFHLGPPGPRGAYQECMDAIAASEGRDTVIDRLHWGELIYGPIYRGKSMLEGWGRYDIDRALIHRGAVIIFCDGHTPDIIARVKTRGDDYVNTDHLQRIMTEYRFTAANSKVPVYLLTDFATDEDMMKIIKLAQDLAAKGRIA